MIRFLALLAALAITGCATQPTVDRPNEEHLQAEAPADWLTGIQTQTSTLRMAEFVHPNIDPETGWQEKITFERLAAQPVAPAGDVVQMLKQEIDGGCPGGQLFNTFSGEENGYASEVVLMTCPRSNITGRGQVTMVKVIQGNDALYTITRARRVAPFDAPDAKDFMPREDIALWSAYLSAVSVCDPRNPDHAC